MERLSKNERNFGPFTIAPWNNMICALICGGDREHPENYVFLSAAGRALRIRIPRLIKPFGKWGEDSREYGFRISRESGSYDFLRIYFGPQTGDGMTTKMWGKFMPWTQWRHVRRSLYSPDGTHFATEQKFRKGDDGLARMRDFQDTKEECPKVHFEFHDYDGEKITATCMIEEMEWHRGEGRFKWLRWFYPAKIKRSLDLQFSEEVGPEKGSWKGGTIGHSVEMLPGEGPEQAFRRYCGMNHSGRQNRKYTLKFIGPCGPPEPKPVTGERAS